MSGKVVAVTGAAGHLGRDLLAQLLHRDDVARVVALDVSPLELSHPKLTFQQRDVRSPDMEQALAGCDTLVHLAFIVECSQDAAAMQAINVDGTRNTLECAARAGVRHVVYTSSIASYGFHPENRGAVLDEETPRRGSDAFQYSKNKAQVEAWLDTFEAAHPGVRVCRLRPSAFLAGDTARPIAAPLRGRFFYQLPGDDLPVHVTHQADIVQALLLAIARDAAGAYNVATDDPLPMSAWGSAMGKRTVRLPGATRAALSLAYRAKLIDVEPAWFTVAASQPIVVSSEKIRRELGWRPSHPTTGVALRAVSGRPTACASRATRLTLGSAAVGTRLRGGLRGARGRVGVLNLLLGGPQPSEWHVVGDGVALAVHRGLRVDADASSSLPDATFHAVLAGRTSLDACRREGSAQSQGAEEPLGLLDALAARFAELRGGRGLRGLPGRTYAGLVLKGAGRGRA